MPPAQIYQQDEADFMQSLLSGLDDKISTIAPNTPPKPKPPKLERLEGVPEKMILPDRKVKLEETLPVISTTNSAAAVSQEDIDMAALLEGAEDWDWEDMNDFMTPKKASPKKPKFTPGLHSPKKPLPQVPKRDYQKECCTRCFVESISETEAKGCLQKKLTVKIEPGEERRSVILQDDWVTTDVRIGDTVNVIGPFEALPSSSSSLTSTIRVTSKSNYLILHPDTLITATALANASHCPRKPLLSSLVRSTSDVTPALVWGNILHEVMQLCMSENCWEEKWIEERIDEAVRKNLVNIVRIEMSVEDSLREVKTRAKGLIAFASKYLGEKPRLEGVLTDTRTSPSDTQPLLAITDLLDVEEDIWSPTYGIRGKIDATVHSIVSQAKPPSNQINHYFPKSREMEIVSGAVPFEIKTGRSMAVMGHRAQTMLYTLLVAERYHQEVDAGLLYYTQREEVVRVPAVRNELRGLMLARNEMAGYMMRRHRASKARRGCREAEEEEEPFLPPTLDDERACKRCYVLDVCMLYRKAVENVVDLTSPIADAYDLKTSHLTRPQLEFFKKWEKLISLEEKDIQRFKKELWTVGAKEREEKGRCFAMMALDTTYDSKFSPPPSLAGISCQDQVDDVEAELANSGKEKIHKFTYRFVRASRTGNQTRISVDDEIKSESLLSGYMGVGEPITVSVEPDLLAIARGFIVDLTPREVVVGVDHELDLKKIRWRLATRRRHQSEREEQPVFRIDKDDLYGGMARMRDNLAQMFYAEGDVKRLELVVDLRRPVFESLPWDDGDVRDCAQSREREEFALHTQHLNDTQKGAVQKALSAKDYTLILGMPGTGKTSVIASLVKVLVAMGKTVLLSAYTHSAVDNVLLRLEEMEKVGFGVLRLGNLDKIHPDVQKFTLARRKQATTIEQLEVQLMSPPVVATTCLSVDHALFSRRKFDYCIVDEASQITLPTCLGPIRFADKFVLVGDHFQLPPLVRSVQARQEGLDISLFRRLSDAHPEAVVELADQYRMNEEIMTLSNRLIYGERLRCGSEEVRTRSLALPRKEVVEKLCERGGVCGGVEGGCWMGKLLDESCKAVFVDTDEIPARESRTGDLIQNEIEAELVRQVTDVLLQSGISAEQIGIITLYRQQVKAISHLLGGRKDVEILTADKSQGRDKDCVIFSMVRSNEENKTGDLMKDWRRMNVSFTRARSKLIIFGSKKTLQAAPLLKEFFGMMDEKGWVLKMPTGAHCFHTVSSGVSLKTTTMPSPVPKMDVDINRNEERKVTPSKRNGERKENVKGEEDGDDRPAKKARKGVDVGILKGKPLLQDVINEWL